MLLINQNKVAKATKKCILDNLCNRIDLKKEDNGRIPFGLVARLVESHKNVCPWLTRDAINNELRRRKRVGICSQSTANSTTTSVENVADAEVAVADSDSDTDLQRRVSGGRPVGTTDKQMKKREDALIASKNEIAIVYNIARN